MKSVISHKIDLLEAFTDDYTWRKNLFEQYISKAKQEFKFLYFLYRDSLALLEKENMLKLDHTNSSKKYFKYGLNSISEFCRLAHFPDEKKEAKIDESEEFIIKVQDTSELKGIRTPIQLARIARNKQKENIIASVPLELLSLNKNINFNQSYINHLTKLEIEFSLTGSFNDNIYTQLLDIYEKNEQFIQAKVDRLTNHTLYYIHPYVKAFKSLTDNNEAEFNQNLIKALEAHKAVWSQKKALNRGGTPLCRENEGFLSWGCTALAAIAYDKGWQLEVESDYMPPFMVDGSINQ